MRTLAAAALVAALQPAFALRKSSSKRNPDRERWAQAVMTCTAGTAARTTESMTPADYDAAYDSIASRYHGLGTACNGTFCPQADWSGCILRASGHDFMDFSQSDGTGGSDGCIDLHDLDNNGLHECLYEGEFGISLLDAYQEHCTTISLADFLVIAGETVMHLARQWVLDENPKAMAIDFKAGFRYGRTTAETCEWAIGRLPDPEDSCAGTEESFIHNMGLNWRESAALMGVHTLGRADPQHSGYDGFWSDVVNQRKFNNNFYLSVMNKGWKPEMSNDNPEKNQWMRSDKGRDDVKLGKEMMLNTDMCLAYTDQFGSAVDAGKLLRAGKPCCAWRFSSDEDFNPPGNNYFAGEGVDFCGETDYFQELWAFGDQRFDCCQTIGDTRAVDCGDSFDLAGPAFDDMKEFAQSEEAWLKAFMLAWRKSTDNGQTNLKCVSEGCGTTTTTTTKKPWFR